MLKAACNGEYVCIRSAPIWGVVSAMLICYAGSALAQNQSGLPNLFPVPDPSGVVETFTTNGKVDMTGPFFQNLGTNGRRCSTCHQPSDAWTVSAAHVKARFDASAGTDPIFRTNDGSNCDHNIDVSTLSGRASAYSLLTSRGLFRIALSVPATAEFTVNSVSNPYGCNETDTLSMYRRPLPSANLRFLTTVMIDGRESSPQTGTQKITFATNPADLIFDLKHQAMDATTGHAQGAPPTDAQQQAIVDFEMGLSVAQAVDFGAGDLQSGGASGGPTALSTQPFFIGVNDLNANGAPGTATIFTLFDKWVASHTIDSSQKASIARGQTLFNSKPITITGVGGLNDDLEKDSITGTCGTCHDSPNVGNHSVPAPLNIGVADVANSLGVDYLPRITLKNKVTGDTITTTDPGRALVTGKWADISKFKGPILRGLAARAPYFHNGSAKTLMDVLDFYDLRFGIGFTPQEKADLVAFLSAL